MAEQNADATRQERTDKVLDMATSEAQTVHGNATAKRVSVKGSIEVCTTEDDSTVADGASATVTLETTHSESAAE